jgi:hypothetical protein
MNRLGTLVTLGLICLVSGCSKTEEGPPPKKTVKVIGTITVNGAAPPWKVQLEARPEAGMDEKQPTGSFAETSEDGSFEFSTYVLGDGIPEGSYLLLAKSRISASVFMQGNEPPDKLGGKYETVKGSPKKFEVKSTGDDTTPIDLGTIDLKANVKKK